MSIEIKLTAAGIKGIASEKKEQKAAAWELYVELITRASTVKLEKDCGLIREAMDSMYSLFETTRQVLKRYGAAIALAEKDEISVAHVAVAVLNCSVRPFLSKWHPRLLDWEHQRGNDVARFAHEASWKEGAECREQLETVRKSLIEYTDTLAKIAAVPNFAQDRHE